MKKLKIKYKNELNIIREFLEEKYSENPRNSFVVSPVMWELIKLLDDVKEVGIPNVQTTRVGKYKNSFILLDEFQQHNEIGVLRKFLLGNVNIY